MRILNLFPGSYGSNCYILEDNGHAVVVDPSAAASSILRQVEKDGCALDAILLTHGHFDHIMSIDTLREAVPGLKVYIHAGDAPMLTDGDKNAFRFFFKQDRVWKPADVLLANGDEIPVGDAILRVIHTPGHSPGSVCYYCEENGLMLTGDTLFCENIGRFDLWGGSFDTIRASLESLRAYDPQIMIYPGHDCNERLGRALDYVLPL